MIEKDRSKDEQITKAIAKETSISQEDQSVGSRFEFIKCQRGYACGRKTSQIGE